MTTPNSSTKTTEERLKEIEGRLLNCMNCTFTYGTNRPDDEAGGDMEFLLSEIHRLQQEVARLERNLEISMYSLLIVGQMSECEHEYKSLVGHDDDRK